jgi:hypothetical protein
LYNKRTHPNGEKTRSCRACKVKDIDDDLGKKYHELTPLHINKKGRRDINYQENDDTYSESNCESEVPSIDP